jgi:hypothetical protein
MSYLVTSDSVEGTFEEMGCQCPMANCGASTVVVDSVGGNSTQHAREEFTCLGCGSRWATRLYMAAIEWIEPCVDGVATERMTQYSHDGRMEKNVLYQEVTCKENIRSALQEFVQAFSNPLSQKSQASALGRLAYMVKQPLRGTPLPLLHTPDGEDQEPPF